MQLLKLNTIVYNVVMDIKGTLTHAWINMNHDITYIFQPRGVDPETKLPVDKVFVESARLRDTETEEVEVPLSVIGTEVEEIGSGFTGIITGLVIHLGGCVHAEVTPKGVSKTSGKITAEIDLRRLIGDAIPSLTKEETKVSEVRRPSPSATIARKNIN